MDSTNARIIPDLFEPFSLCENVFINSRIVFKLGIIDFTRTSYIKGICTSDVMSDAFPTHVMTFWNTKVTSLKHSIILSGDIGCFSRYNISSDIYKTISSSSMYCGKVNIFRFKNLCRFIELKSFLSFYDCNTGRLIILYNFSPKIICALSIIFSSMTPCFPTSSTIFYSNKEYNPSSP